MPCFGDESLVVDYVTAQVTCLTRYESVFVYVILIKIVRAKVMTMNIFQSMSTRLSTFKFNLIYRTVMSQQTLQEYVFILMQ